MTPDIQVPEGRENFHYGPDPSHGGVTRHEGIRELCTGPDCYDAESADLKAAAGKLRDWAVPSALVDDEGARALAEWLEEFADEGPYDIHPATRLAQSILAAADRSKVTG
jgi:hypothetical protein